MNDRPKTMAERTARRAAGDKVRQRIRVVDGKLSGPEPAVELVGTPLSTALANAQADARADERADTQAAEGPGGHAAASDDKGEDGAPMSAGAWAAERADAETARTETARTETGGAETGGAETGGAAAAGHRHGELPRGDRWPDGTSKPSGSAPEPQGDASKAWGSAPKSHGEAPGGDRWPDGTSTPSGWAPEPQGAASKPQDSRSRPRGEASKPTSASTKAKHAFAATRSVARKLALQAIYRWLLNEAPWQDLVKEFGEAEDMPNADPKYFRDLVEGVTAVRTSLDEKLIELVDRPIAQLDPVEHAVLLIGLYELSAKREVPYRVAINEAVGLAKRFGATDGHKFVNAVLDRAARTLRPGEN